jgi:hypothetical protein
MIEAIVRTHGLTRERLAGSLVSDADSFQTNRGVPNTVTGMPYFCPMPAMLGQNFRRRRSRSRDFQERFSSLL